jgi:ABC-type bacteriocin/lantibiotic exporter with double-glycine peptidase domain
MFAMGNTGNKYPSNRSTDPFDAVLGFADFEHLPKLPPRYFESRPTGVIMARLRGVKNIREFVASAAITQPKGKWTMILGTSA